jgi:hypothetical protein
MFVHELLKHVIYVYQCLGRLKNSQFRKEQKGKAQMSKPRKPRGWVPATVPPNPTASAQTRARKTHITKYEQQCDNDDTIWEVLAHFEGGDCDILPNAIAPESQYTIRSFDNYTINLWERVFQDDAWRSMLHITKIAGFGATHPGGALQKPVPSVGTEVPHHLRHLYVSWNTDRVGWAVLVPNRFLSDASFYTGYTPSWTQGNIIGEGRKIGSGENVIICDLSECDMERHMEKKDCCIALGPAIRAVDSEGGHGYG